MKSHMNWWVKCTSAVIAKTASRNVAFKARRLRESIMEGQDSFIMREPEDVEVEFGEDSEDVVADAGPLTFHVSWVRMYFIISRLVLTKRR